MAVKATLGSGFRDILTQIKKRELAPIYLLSGDEPYYLDQLADVFEGNVIEEGDRDFNQSTLYGADTDAANIVSAAQQYPFMADRRLVVVREMQSMYRAKFELEKIAPYAERPNEETTLVLVYKGEAIRATSALVKAIKKGGGIVFTSNKLRDYELKGPIRDYVTSKGFGIDDDAIEMLAAMIGSDLSKLFGEIDKMVIAAGEKMKRITGALVRSMTGISKEFAPYELAKAVGARDFMKSMVIVSQAARNPSKNPTALIVPAIFKLVQNLCIAHRAENKTEIGIQTATGAKNVYAVREIIEAMRNYNLTQCLGAISAIREFDCNTKGIRSQQKEHELLRELVFRIMAL